MVFVGVSNNDTVEDGMRFVEEFDVPYQMAHAPEVWEQFDVPYQPVTIVFDSEHEIVERFTGPIEYESLKAAIEKVL